MSFALIRVRPDSLALPARGPTPTSGRHAGRIVARLRELPVVGLGGNLDFSSCELSGKDLACRADD